ncbi:restriction endonuclease [Chryseobacterium sp. Leaf404]|uniref:Uma2 family endonuclease n=1 Tax=unclassified Chryseobacterium TaxID=2593645 RepID=UPI0006F5065F|nr:MULTISPECIES: Uma2 family endonuclease [unclassified Chryseobacterium]KQT19288.1 restriction endonuclease [Chryseobacterium sp. Leaf404]
MEITSLSQLDMNATYTFADYLMWKIKDRVELFRGKILKMSPSPSPMHQRIARKLSLNIGNLFSNKSCEMFFAPFDVRFPNKMGEIITVVQPDICIICDRNKIDDKGCLGAPDLVIEILSPGNSKKEMNLKFSLYEESGVSEYWVVDSSEKFILIYSLENGEYISRKPVADGEMLQSIHFPDLRFSTQDLYEF